ncbi:hypothetical protein ABEY65_23035 [Priestia aryabhattai]|uniref:hypothetical protein n=1 Tax=Priestia aryabhattai TaxID=412384 RepID=UPI002E1CBFCE|nr:hypothetical protein [Priestia aryabhattai]
MLTAKKYAFVDSPIYSNQKRNFNSYLKKNLNVTVFEFEGNLFDIRTLNRPVNLDCMNCHLAHTKGCCDGSPYPPLEEDIDVVSNKINVILKEAQSRSDYLKAKTLIKEQGLLDNRGSFITNCGKCIFSTKLSDSDTHVCSIHSYALNRDIDYTLLKPKGCMMYPLDSIVLSNGKHFIFGIDDESATQIVECTNEEEKFFRIAEENKGFSRWNNNDLEYICVNKKHRQLIHETRKDQSDFSKGTLPDNVFELKNYMPIYKQEKKLLTRLYGKEAYNFIESKSMEIF